MHDAMIKEKQLLLLICKTTKDKKFHLRRVFRAGLNLELLSSILFTFFEQFYNLVTPVERTMRPCVGNEYFPCGAIYKEMCRDSFYPVQFAYVGTDNDIPPL